MTTSPPQTELFLAAVLQHSREAILVTGADGRVRWSSPQAAPLLGGRMADAVHPDDRRRVAAVYRHMAAQPGGQQALTCRVHDGSGGWRTAEIGVANRLADPDVQGWVTVVREPFADAASNARLLHRATHDSLTELPNRGALLRQLERASDGSVVVLFIDLDGFKAVNDTMGHAAGDEVLVAIAGRLRRTVRPGDTVGRLGGDEFVIFASGVERPADAREIANRVREAVARPLRIAGRTVRVTASVGIAIGHDAHASALLGDADAAMYLAKQAGRDRCALFDAGVVGGSRAATEQLRRSASAPRADELTLA